MTFSWLRGLRRSYRATLDAWKKSSKGLLLQFGTLTFSAHGQAVCIYMLCNEWTQSINDLLYSELGSAVTSSSSCVVIVSGESKAGPV